MWNIVRGYDLFNLCNHRHQNKTFEKYDGFVGFFYKSSYKVKWNPHLNQNYIEYLFKISIAYVLHTKRGFQSWLDVQEVRFWIRSLLF